MLCRGRGKLLWETGRSSGDCWPRSRCPRLSGGVGSSTPPGPDEANLLSRGVSHLLGLVWHRKLFGIVVKPTAGTEVLNEKHGAKVRGEVVRTIVSDVWQPTRGE